MEEKIILKNGKQVIFAIMGLLFLWANNDISLSDTLNNAAVLTDFSFGYSKIIGNYNKDDLDDYFKNIGPDANNVEYNDEILHKINKSNKCIKTILLDQSILSGIGNIYADEILFKARINPFMKGKDISKNDLENIIKYSKEILDDSIKHKGTTIKSYTFSLNHAGSYQDYLLVHKNDGKHCKVCNEIILKTKIDGRSTYYCKKCQGVK